MTPLLLVWLALTSASPAGAPARAPPPKPIDAAAEAARLSPEQLLEKVRSLNQDLEFDKLVPYAQELVGRREAPLQLKREGWLMLGTAFVILGDPVAAELPFTQLLRVVPDFQLPQNVEPKVALVFRKVQAEERELARALKASNREARIRAVSIAGDPPASPRGGVPMRFEYRLTDPAEDVRTFRVAYRRQGDPAFSSLALVEASKGAWSGSLPAEVSANDAGLVLEYFLETADNEGPLRLQGAPQAPLTLNVSPGQVETPRKPPLPKWLFFTSAAVTVAASAVAGTLYFNYRSQQADFERYVSSSMPLSYPLVEQLRADGQTAATRATVALITAASLLVATGLIALFVDWSD